MYYGLYIPKKYKSLKIKPLHFQIVKYHFFYLYLNDKLLYSIQSVPDLSTQLYA